LDKQPDDISRIRARHALKILLDVHGQFGHDPKFAQAAGAYANATRSSSFPA
jgi:hypothetical protein